MTLMLMGGNITLSKVERQPKRNTAVTYIVKGWCSQSYRGSKYKQQKCTSIYNRKVLSVTKKEHFAQRSQINFHFYFQVGLHGFSWFQVGFSWFLVCFHGSRLVFHGSMSVSMVFRGSRLFFHGSRSVLMVFHGSRLVFHGFSPK